MVTIKTRHRTVMNLMILILGIHTLQTAVHKSFVQNAECFLCFFRFRTKFSLSIHSGKKQVENQQYLSWTCIYIHVFMSVVLLLIWFHFFGFSFIIGYCLQYKPMHVVQVSLCLWGGAGGNSLRLFDLSVI